MKCKNVTSNSLNTLIFGNYQPFSKRLFPVLTFNVLQKFLNNIFETKPCSFLRTSHFSSKNIVFQQLSNLRSIEYSFIQFSIGQLRKLRRYILETLFILKLTSEVCSLLCRSDLKNEFGALKSMKIQCWLTNFAA